METIVKEPLLQLENRVTTVAGFAYGLRSQAILVNLNIRSPIGGGCLKAFGEIVEKVLTDFPVKDIPPPSLDHDNLFSLLTGLLHRLLQLQKSANMPVFEPGRIVAVSQSREKVLLAIPSAHPQAHQATIAAFHWLLNVVNCASTGVEAGSLLQAWPKILALMEKVVPTGTNVPRFMRAAHSMNIPVMPVADEILQYGQGRQARWLQSSFTDETSALGVRLARNKALTASVLRSNGLPVPQHRQVKTIKETLVAVESLGYPVVIKPINLDGGIGVAAGLTTTEDVRKAFLAAQNHSQQLLVEKHVDGRDYRLTVFQGELIWAVERVPGSVTGDGRQTVRSLIDQLNADPRRGTGRHAPLRRLEWDEEAQNLLSQAALEIESVPPAGQFIRLRRIANTARGGMPVAVFDRVHPDNKRLAERAADALRLDFAGVDLLIPDISRSWLETGGVICEVNGQPQLGDTTGPHLYGSVLGKLISGDGRLPILVVLGGDGDSSLVGEIVEALSARGEIVGVADQHQVVIDGTCIVQGIGTFAGGRVLMSDQRIDTAILCINDGEPLQTGLPFDRYDLLLLASADKLQGDEKPTGRTKGPTLQNIIKAVLPACVSKVIPLADCRIRFHASNLSAITSARLEDPIARDQVAARIASELFVANKQHRAPAPQ